MWRRSPNRSKKCIIIHIAIYLRIVKIARQLMEDFESENDFRKNVVKHLKYK